MAQTEMMLRLIKDEKIDGFIQMRSGGMALYRSADWDINKWERRDIDFVMQCIDSFELGIKQDNGDWFFDNDIIKYKIRGEGNGIHTGVLGFYGSGFSVVEDSYSGGIHWDDIEPLERIGNNHEDNPELTEGCKDGTG